MSRSNTVHKMTRLALHFGRTVMSAIENKHLSATLARSETLLGSREGLEPGIPLFQPTNSEEATMQAIMTSRYREAHGVDAAN